MRTLFLIAFSIFSGTVATAQCVPQTDFGNEDFGVSPDTVENFVSGTVGEFYSQQVDVKVPENAGFISPLFVFIPIDSAVFVSVTGLPDGFDFECNNTLVTPCAFAGGEIGCGLAEGIPQEAGTFDLEVNLMIYAGTESFPFTIEEYQIVIEEGTVRTNDSQETVFELGLAAPNPADEYTSVVLSATRAETALITVHDLAGRVVHSKQVQVNTGENTFRINTGTFDRGIYVYRIDAAGRARSGKFVVSR